MPKTIVAIQGIKGSFHHEAARELLPDKQLELLCCDTFREVFDSLANGQTEYGIAAIENTLNGSINAVYRLLSEKKLFVVGEVFLKIEQYLIAGSAEPVTSLNNAATKVMSHPVALAQCEIWLAGHLPLAEREERADTAESVAYIVGQKVSGYLAIAGEEAARLYGGTIIAGPINDDTNNFTRFFLLARRPISNQAANKTSIILLTTHQPGSLYAALGVFAKRNINLSKVDSHLIPDDTWHYAFYIDYDSSNTDVIAELEALGNQVRVLGSYEEGSLP